MLLVFICVVKLVSWLVVRLEEFFLGWFLKSIFV